MSIFWKEERENERKSSSSAHQFACVWLNLNSSICILWLMVPLLDWFNDETRAAIRSHDADFVLHKMMNGRVENAKFYNHSIFSSMLNLKR